MIECRTRVKVCGITRAQDALLAQQLGVDAIGFVFVSASARHIEPEEAALIAKELDPFTTLVGLFLDAPSSLVNRVLDHLPGMVPQFHGQESAEYCESFNRPYIKALGVKDSLPVHDDLARFTGATGFLLDSHQPGGLGGTGHTFDWDLLQHPLGKALIVAGGLHADNVGDAIRQLQPAAVDVSSGVESEKGRKCPSRLRAFVQAVADADAQTPQLAAV